VHPWVGYSQTRLRALGYGDLDVDQRFGPATRAAVVRFEQVNKTEVDGRLEADERLLLLSNDAIANTAVPQPVSGAVTPAKAPAKLVPPTTPPPPPAPAPAPAPTPSPAGGFATPATARTNANCQAIAAEFVRQGAPAPVAEEFAYMIAPRESGCVPQEVNNSTDLSYSRIGLNFKGNMPRYWGNLCGVTDYRLTADLVIDVKCGLAAYNALGWKPWAVG
jgi:peptidoglycan hydrolase-like protein with peptidoglycan-binding domain